jgi:hypothetical protein
VRAALAFLLTALLAACSGEAARHAAAAAAFGAFQDAVFAGDRAALAAALTATSRRVLDDLPLDRVAGKERLTVIGCETAEPVVLVHARDPERGGRKATFVVVREAGRMRVDLVATAAWHQVPVAPEPGAPRWRLAPLPEAEIDEIRARHAAPIR